MTQLWLLFAAAFAGGWLTCSLMVLVLRDRVIDNALARREREIYGPLLERVEAQAERVEARHQDNRKRDRGGMAVGAASIRLDDVAGVVPVPRNHRSSS
ncbi:MAG: hypothetical protein ABWY93_22685 [Mycobacterium sp.]